MSKDKENLNLSRLEIHEESQKNTEVNKKNKINECYFIDEKLSKINGRHQESHADRRWCQPCFFKGMA